MVVTDVSGHLSVSSSRTQDCSILGDGTDRWSQKSVNKYQSMLRNIRDEQRSQLAVSSRYQIGKGWMGPGSDLEILAGGGGGKNTLPLREMQYQTHPHLFAFTAETVVDTVMVAHLLHTEWQWYASEAPWIFSTESIRLMDCNERNTDHSHNLSNAGLGESSGNLEGYKGKFRGSTADTGTSRIYRRHSPTVTK
jgi:hypothetical protein